MHKKFEINQTKIKGGCQSGSKVVSHNSKSDLPLSKVDMCLRKIKKLLLCQDLLDQLRHPNIKDSRSSRKSLTFSIPVRALVDLKPLQLCCEVKIGSNHTVKRFYGRLDYFSILDTPLHWHPKDGC